MGLASGNDREEGEEEESPTDNAGQEYARRTRAFVDYMGAPPLADGSCRPVSPEIIRLGSLVPRCVPANVREAATRRVGWRSGVLCSLFRASSSHFSRLLLAVEDIDARWTRRCGPPVERAWG